MDGVLVPGFQQREVRLYGAGEPFPLVGVVHKGSPVEADRRLEGDAIGVHVHRELIVGPREEVGFGRLRIRPQSAEPVLAGEHQRGRDGAIGVPVGGKGVV